MVRWWLVKLVLLLDVLIVLALLGAYGWESAMVDSDSFKKGEHQKLLDLTPQDMSFPAAMQVSQGQGVGSETCQDFMFRLPWTVQNKQFKPKGLNSTAPFPTCTLEGPEQQQVTVVVKSDPAAMQFIQSGWHKEGEKGNPLEQFFLSFMPVSSFDYTLRSLGVTPRMIQGQFIPGERYRLNEMLKSKEKLVSPFAPESTLKIAHYGSDRFEVIQLDGAKGATLVQLLIRPKQGADVSSWLDVSFRQEEGHEASRLEASVEAFLTSLKSAS